MTSNFDVQIIALIKKAFSLKKKLHFEPKKNVKKGVFIVIQFFTKTLRLDKKQIRSAGR